MDVLVLAAEADGTRQTVSFLILCLVGIAAGLTLLTVWYWFYTDPKRRASAEVGSTPEVLPSPVPEVVVEAGDRPADQVETTEGRSAPEQAPLELDAPTSSDDRAGRPVLEPAGDPEGADVPDPAIGPALARQTWDFVDAARRAESPQLVGEPHRAAAPRIAVPDRAGDDGEETGDELAVARRRREREARGLSDEAWQAVRRSVLDKLDG